MTMHAPVGVQPGARERTTLLEWFQSVSVAAMTVTRSGLGPMQARATSEDSQTSQNQLLVVSRANPSAGASQVGDVVGGCRIWRTGERGDRLPGVQPPVGVALAGSVEAGAAAGFVESGPDLPESGRDRPERAGVAAGKESGRRARE
jgi:hypothetical protein